MLVVVELGRVRRDAHGMVMVVVVVKRKVSSAITCTKAVVVMSL
jgi:hypothetical protein